MVSRSKIFIVAVVFSALLLAACGTSGGEQYIGFAQCLTQKGVTMYGAYWCPHCANQKKLFGAAFDEVNYVECDPRGKDANPTLCLQKKIKRYPTWEYPDGTREEGEKTFKQLSLKSGCELPPEPSEEATGDDAVTAEVEEESEEAPSVE